MNTTNNNNINKTNRTNININLQFERRSSRISRTTYPFQINESECLITDGGFKCTEKHHQDALAHNLSQHNTCWQYYCKVRGGAMLFLVFRGVGQEVQMSSGLADAMRYWLWFIQWFFNITCSVAYIYDRVCFNSHVSLHDTNLNFQQITVWYFQRSIIFGYIFYNAIFIRFFF